MLATLNQMPNGAPSIDGSQYRVVELRGVYARCTTTQEVLGWMADDLESSPLQVALVPAPDPQFMCHMIRVAIQRPPHWYSRLCARYPSGTGRTSTVIRNHDIVRILRRLADGKPSTSQYAPELLEFAAGIYEENFNNEPF